MYELPTASASSSFSGAEITVPERAALTSLGTASWLLLLLLSAEATGRVALLSCTSPSPVAAAAGATVNASVSLDSVSFSALGSVASAEFLVSVGSSMLLETASTTAESLPGVISTATGDASS